LTECRVIRLKVVPLASSQTVDDSDEQPEQPDPNQDSPPSEGCILGPKVNLVKPTNFTSHIWKHFMIQKGNIKSKGFCNYCDQGISRGGSQTTTNMIQHLRRAHPEEYADLVREEEASGQSNDRFPRQSKPHLIKDALIEMMVEGHIPYTMLKLMGLKKLMAACGIRSRVPDKRTVQARMGVIEAQTKGKLKDLVAGKKVSITCDGWKANNNVDYLGITACWVDDVWKLQTVTLDCTVFPGRHSSERIAERLKLIIKG
jgi:BED zinc finger